jgi:hypothetical protein
MSLTERLYRLRCIALEAELERMRKRAEEEDVTPIVLEKYPEASAELLRWLEEEEHRPTRDLEPEDLAAMSDDELERRAQAILERQDRERAGGMA